MAVDFYKGLSALLDDLRRYGFCPSVTKKTGEERVLAAEIAVKGEMVVHWDRQSRSVWVEGPWPAAARLEGRLRRRYEGRLLKVGRRSKIVAGIIAAVALLAASYFLSGRSRNLTSQQTQPASAPVEPMLANGTGSR